ncbi:2OG-Fe(II) oxygenase [Catenovulum sp. SM1970]|uniref:2OG-Fe(II) oxygenase n=1 Tax=Marinifaba aquimaris TaxID=2741323 RepID=UPI00157408EA|nr:2OG-Fe(II) oxygenase [Marinifaba aquimaris]NTS77184.1 2OG-Fe(II) oxygenase [Marinifaba aquimaris]
MKQYRSKTINVQPNIRLFSDVITCEEINYIKAQAEPQLSRAQVSDDEQGFVSQARTNQVAWLSWQKDQTIQTICQRIADLVSCPLSHAESLQVIRYQQNQEYQAHFDAYDLNTPTGQNNTKHGGQRLHTALLYLSTVTEGGQTSFPNLNIAIKPRAGYLLSFDNCLADNQTPAPASLHASIPVVSGEKWACNLWFRAQPYLNHSIK